MPSYVVLLRGINVGKAKRVPMAELKQLLEELGCTRVTTLLNSGNAVIDHSRISPQTLSKKVASAIAERFGFNVSVIVKTTQQLETIVTSLQLDVPQGDHPKLLVALAQDSATIAGLKSLAELVKPPEAIQLEPSAAYLYCAKGILESEAAGWLLGKQGQLVTTRNWATLLKISRCAAQAQS